MSFRLAAYAVCVDGGRVLLARHVPPKGESTWTLPGGRVEHAEDPFDAVIREVAEETGCDAVVERLLGVDSRVIPAAERAVPAEPSIRTSVSSTRFVSPEAHCVRSRTAKSPSRSGLRFPRSLACAGHRWSTSDLPWLGRFRSLATSLPFRSAD
jgi:ADP-ribose pyrophosphatase YjhB (NUDIX family)